MNLRRGLCAVGLGVLPLAWGRAQSSATASPAARLVLLGLDGRERVVSPADFERLPSARATDGSRTVA